MYSEESLKNYIFWLKFRRVFFIIVFSLVGCLVGMLANHFLTEILQLGEYLKYICIAAGVIIFFLLSLLCTAGTGKQIQEGYWKIAVLRKLTVISKKLDRVQIKENDSKMVNEVTRDIQKSVAQVLEEVEGLEDLVGVEGENESEKKRTPSKELKKIMKESKGESNLSEEDTDVLKEIDDLDEEQDDNLGETKVIDVKEVQKQLEKSDEVVEDTNEDDLENALEESKEEEKAVKKVVKTKKKKSKEVQEEESEEEKPKFPTIRDEV